MRLRGLCALLLLSAGCGSGGGSPEIIVPSAAQARPDCHAILTSEQIEEVRSQFALFQPELYCLGANPSDGSSLLPENYVPARWFGEQRPSDLHQTGLGIQYKGNGFERFDVLFSLPTRIDYFDTEGNPFSVELPNSDLDRQIRVTATAIDQVFLAVQDDLGQQFPEVRDVNPSSITLKFEPTIFFVFSSNFGDTWAGGVTSLDGRNIHVAFFHLSPRQKLPISWRGIPGVSRGWLENEFRNALLIQTGHTELAE